MNKNFFSPLEQFEIYPIFSICLGNIDFSITNHAVALFIVFGFIYFFFFNIVDKKNGTLLVIPNRWQVVLELMYLTILKMVFANIPKKEGQYYFPFIFTLFIFILSLNLIGLVPYNVTVTAQLCVTFTLSLIVFAGINIIGFRTHGLNFFTIFLPLGGEGLLSLILVPVEIISYICKPISLALRLFANMMAGHVLMKILAGVCWSLSGCSGVLFLMQVVPLVILVLLIILELIIAVIQAVVFSMLVSTYIHDVIFLH